MLRKIFRRGGGALLCFFALIGVVVADTSGLKTSDATLRFLGNEDLPPLLFKQDGKPVGLTYELVDAALNAAGVDYNIELMNWAEAQSLVQEGSATGLIQINKSPARLELYDFSQPLIVSEFAIFIASDNQTITQFQHLAGRRVGSENKGYARVILERESTIDIVTIPNWKAGFEMVGRGELDALVTEKWVGEYVLSTNQISGIKVSPYPVELSEAYIAIEKGNPALLSAINSGLAAIDENGTREAIMSKWRGETVQYITLNALETQNYIRILLIGLAFALLICLIGLGYIIRQKRSLAQFNQLLEARVNERTCALQTRYDREREMLSIIGHELRTPLSSISMMYDAISLAKQEPYGRQIVETHDTVLEILNDLRFVMQPDAVRGQNLVSSSPVEVVEKTLNSIREWLASRDYVYHLEKDSVCSQPVRLNAVAIRQIVTNLVKNAAVHSGGTDVWVSLKGHPDGSNFCLTLEVEDNGRGIPNHLQEKIFEAFGRGDTLADGMGLGLYIIRTLSKELDAKVSYFDSPRGGAGFRLNFRFPELDSAAENRSSQKMVSNPLNGKRVLFAEDQLTLQLLTKSVLEKAGVHTVVASNGLEALAAYNEGMFDIVLTDAMMPQMDGYALAGELRKLGFTGPIIAITAAVIGDETERLLSAGVDVVLSKPLDLEQLKVEVSRLLERT